MPSVGNGSLYALLFNHTEKNYASIVADVYTIAMTVSIIIVTFNTLSLVRECLQSLKNAEPTLKKNGYSMEVLISDNGTDETASMVEKEFPEVKVQRNGNIGFGQGNNAVKHLSTGKYILMLNPDTTVKDDTLPLALTYMEEHARVGAMTGKIIMMDGTLDRDARRSFPTPWVAISHMTYLDRLFPTSKLFAKYWYGYASANEEAEIDVLQGAFCLVRRDVMDQVDWYDKAYFLDGEDIDLCWKIKKAGWGIRYYPNVEILHHKGATKGKNPTQQKVDPEVRRKAISAGVDAMAIFYKKRMWSEYPLIINFPIVLGIKILKYLRLLQYEVTRRI